MVSTLILPIPVKRVRVALYSLVVARGRCDYGRIQPAGTQTDNSLSACHALTGVGTFSQLTVFGQLLWQPL